MTDRPELHLVPEDPTCQCGYRQSIHAETPYTCARFKRSAFFTQLPADMPEVERYVGTKRLKNQKENHR